MVKEKLNGIMEQLMKVNSIWVILKGKVLWLEKMVKNIKVCSKIIKCMVMVSSIGQMVSIIKDIIKKTLSMVKVNLDGIMVMYFKGIL